LSANAVFASQFEPAANLWNRHETGARKYLAYHDPDPRDAFSQKAAENEKSPRSEFSAAYKRNAPEAL
jgi:hypothetical protein